jgi:hypothetical protein
VNIHRILISDLAAPAKARRSVQHVLMACWLALAAGIAGSGNGLAQGLPALKDILPFATPFENRVDLNGDGIYDSYWTLASANSVCTISLFNIASQSKRWSTDRFHAACRRRIHRRASRFFFQLG